VLILKDALGVTPPLIRIPESRDLPAPKLQTEGQIVPPTCDRNLARQTPCSYTSAGSQTNHSDSIWDEINAQNRIEDCKISHICTISAAH
jgi:hypothetical protein